MKSKIDALIELEAKRQSEYVEIIASENFVSEAVLRANGSVLTNKYAEGYPSRRYYDGCEVIDEIETLAIETAKKIFNAKFANVQPHSGTQANMAVYMAFLKPGDKILGLSLTSGGHLTHGHFVSNTGKIFDSKHYTVDETTGILDYDAILEVALKEKPKMIICGASAYSRKIDFSKFREIADKVGALLLADIAHISGLVVTGRHQNPLPYCDIVTTTTHKTLRGPRGGLILTNNPEIAEKIDKSVFPGTQGGPIVNIIAAKAVAFEEATTPEFKTYIDNVLSNMKAMENVFRENKIKMITDGTDNHLILIDVKKSFNITGQRASSLLFLSHIIVNKNTIPFETLGPNITSGIRIGSPAMTTKGFTNVAFEKLTSIIIDVLKHNDEEYAKNQTPKILKLIKEYEH